MELSSGIGSQEMERPLELVVEGEVEISDIRINVHTTDQDSKHSVV